jgi:hypothetical protein
VVEVVTTVVRTVVAVAVLVTVLVGLFLRLGGIILVVFGGVSGPVLLLFMMGGKVVRLLLD